VAIPRVGRTACYAILALAGLTPLAGCGGCGGNHGGGGDQGKGGGATDGKAGVQQTGGTIVPTPRDLVGHAQPGFLSPPVIVPPLLGCGTAVTVQGFVPGATIDIVSGGAHIGGGLGTQPWGQTFPISPALVVGASVTATQTLGGPPSNPSDAVPIQNWHDVYPEGLPRPHFPALPLYQCGVATVVDSLPPGGTLRVSAGPSGGPAGVVGQVVGVAAAQSVGIGPAFVLNHEVTAQAQICSDLSPVSTLHVVQQPPPVLPAPEFRGLIEGGTWVVLGQLVNGTSVTIKNGAATIGGGGAPATLVRFPVSPALPAAGTNIQATQELCGVQSGPGSGTVQPCSNLPPVHMHAPLPGDTRVRLIDPLPGASTLIFASAQEVGNGGGPVVQLIRALKAGETVVAIQVLGSCIAGSADQVTVGQGLDDPGQGGGCAVQELEYGKPGTPGARTTDITAYFNSPDASVSTPMSAVPLHAIVRYPRGLGPFPLVLVVHGNHSPTEASEPGYVYLLDHLASHCMIAASVDENFLNGNVGGEMGARAIVLLRHLQLWREWTQTPGNQFFGRVDLGAIGIAGHSRGGEMVTVAPIYDSVRNNPADPAHDFDFGIRGAYAIAPVDGQLSDPLVPKEIVRTTDYYVMHGTHDGDVSDFQGYKNFDRAFPVGLPAAGFKGLLWVYGANHGQWNTVWGTGSEWAVDPAADRISGDDQRAIGKTYMTAFFLSSLAGYSEYNSFFSGEASFGALPRAVRRVFQYQDPRRIFLDDYEESADPAAGSYPGVTNAPVGPLSPYSRIAFSDRGPSFWTWEETEGLEAGWQQGAEVDVKVPPDLAAKAAGFPFLALRVAQNYEPSPSRNTPGVDKDFSVQIRLFDVDLPEVAVSSLVALPYPEVTNHPKRGNQTKTVLQTLRIPWSRFLGDRPLAELGHLSMIRLKFNRQQSGLVAIDEIQFTR